MTLDEDMRALERAAAFGDAEATTKLRNFYVRFGESLPLSFLERGASLGVIEAAVLLHDHYVRFGVSMPVTRTFQLVQRSAREKLVEVARSLGWLPDVVARVPARRSRVRRVSEQALAETAREKALVTRRFAYFARHGGSVPNSYGYPAWTEGVVAVARPDGRVVVGVNFLPANKVTLKGAAFAGTGREAAAASDLWDARVKSPARKRAARAALVRWADFPREWNPPTPAKARLMLHEGKARGYPLTERQRRYFGAVASGVARNPGGDETLRDLERRAFEGDQRAALQLAVERERRDGAAAAFGAALEAGAKRPNVKCLTINEIANVVSRTLNIPLARGSPRHPNPEDVVRFSAPPLGGGWVFLVAGEAWAFDSDTGLGVAIHFGVVSRSLVEEARARGVGIPHQSIHFDDAGPIAVSREVAERWLLLRNVGQNPPVPPAPRPEEIRVVCMVCGVHVRGDPRAPHVSHGYCESCGRAELEKWRPRRQTKRQNPDEDLRALERRAEGGNVDALERLLVESMRRDDRALSLTVDAIAMRFYDRGMWSSELERKRLHEIGLRSWEHRNRVVRTQGARFSLPFAGNPDEEMRRLSREDDPRGERMRARALGWTPRRGDLAVLPQDVMGTRSRGVDDNALVEILELDVPEGRRWSEPRKRDLLSQWAWVRAVDTDLHFWTRVVDLQPYGARA